MLRWLPTAVVCLLVALVARGENWPGFRGPAGDGKSAEKNLPIEWDKEKNVKWKAALPDRGNASPIVWGDRVFITQAIAKENQRGVMCFDRNSGQLLWEKYVEYKEKEPTHGTNPYGSATPAADGERVFVSLGSAGVACFDFKGNQLWHQDLGLCHHIWGNAASPVLYKDLVILNFGPGERTFLIAMSKKDGKEVWKVDEPGGKFGDKGREEWVGSWSTPVVAAIDGKDQLLMSWGGCVKSYDPSTGELLWTCKGLERTRQPDRLTYTSPIVSGEVVVAMAGYGGPWMAVNPIKAKGDVTETHQLWRHENAPQRIGTGVLVGDHIYFPNEPGTFQCVEWKTGKTVYNERLSEKIWGSAVVGDDKIYVTDTKGETFVIAARPKFELLARNPLGEETMATPAISQGDIFIRTYKHLWCIGVKK